MPDEPETSYLLSNPLSELSDQKYHRHHYRNVVFRVSEPYKEWVELLAGAGGLNISQLLVKALEEYSKRWKLPAPPQRCKHGRKQLGGEQ